MYKKIIVSLSLDHGFGSRAIEIARRLKSDDGEIIAVHVFETVNNSVGLFVPPGHLAEVRKNAEEEIAQRIGEEKNVEIVMLEGHSGRTIPEYAEQIGADCILVGSHKPGLSDYFLGSTAARIVRHAPCSVHVLR